MKYELIPIGKPIDNITLYILDEKFNNQPVGVTGELFIGGVGLSRGYLKNEKITNEKFLINPFDSGARLYKTGDFARWLPDGNIEFLGRKDEQVKIRGFRIEIGEILNVILEHPDIKDAVVVCREEKGNKYLCAYIVLQSELNINELKEYLSMYLTEYMIPSYFIEIDKIPITQSGKVDKKSLPKPLLKLNKEYTAPRNFIEKQLAEIWSDVLDVDETVISIDENFFDLGGHSLKAIVLVSKIRKVFNVELPLIKIFSDPTIKEIAQFIKDSVITIHEDIKLSEKREYYPQSSSEKRLYFLNQFEEVGLSYNMPSAFKIEGEFDIDKFKRTISKLIERHEILRTTFHFIDNTPVQIVKKEKYDVDIEVLELSKEQVTDGLIETFIQPFNLTTGPLLRFKIIKFSESEYLFFYDLHHIISDGTSLGLLIEDFINIYDNQELSQLNLQYKDFSVWQNRFVRSDIFQNQEKYWLNQFSEEIPVLNLPSDFPRPMVQSFKGERFSVSLNKEETFALKDLAAKENVTLYMLFLTLLNILLSKLSGQNDIVIGTPIAGRKHADLLKLVGMFVNTLALRNFPNEDKIFREFLREVKNNSISAFENQDYQFEDLVDKVVVNRDTSRNPLFVVKFVMQNMEIKNREAKNLKFYPYNYNFNISKFDISVDCYENEDFISLVFEYNTDIFKRETIDKYVNYLRKIISYITENPERRISEIDIITKEEKSEILYEFNNTKSQFASTSTISQLFELRVQQFPDKVAAIFKNNYLTYSELNKRSNQLAHYLIDIAGVKLEERIGVYLERGFNMIISLHGILKSGGAYVPLEANLPEQRIKSIIDDAGIITVVSNKKHIKSLNRLQWECQSFENFVCLDSYDILNESELSENELMNSDLWDYFGENATDLITGGGWFTSYTGQPFTKKEMDEYSENVNKKLLPFLDKNQKILEIGCASGLTMFSIAPHVKMYHGTDMSPVIIEKNEKYIQDQNMQNIKLSCLPAHKIDEISDKFDVIIINSVVHCFHGHNYLRKVLRKAISLIKDKGFIFIGDVLDQDLKEDLIKDISEFKKSSKGEKFKTKIDWSNDLFVARDLFTDFKSESPEIQSVQFSNKIYTIENELTKYRYDILLKIEKGKQKYIQSKTKKQHDLTHIERQIIENCNLAIKSNNLAYVIYTSGTTGNPKGVMIEHQSVVNRLNWMQKKYPQEVDDVILQKTPFSFDVSVWELFWWSIIGSKVCLLEHGGEKNPQVIIDAILNQGISTIHFVPSMLNAFLEHISEVKVANKLASLKYVFASGEALSSTQVEKFNDLFSSSKVRLTNLYGPTEATIDVSYFDCPNDQKLHIIPIGRPIDNIKLFILDNQNRIQPIGITGELCIAGLGLARGYLNNETHTQEKFFEIPDSDLGRIYKTGDYARWIADGNIEFLGRKDDQVKIRGFRIELAEIQNKLLLNESVKDCVVVAKTGKNNHKYIVAYIIKENNIEIQELKEHVARYLPEYMVPQYLIFIDKIPMTVNGKLDTKSLPNTEILINENYIAPRDKIEEIINNIWVEVLCVDKEQIGINRNFFELGGDSINVIQVNSRLLKYNIKLEIKDVFLYPTIAELRHHVRFNEEIADQGSVMGEIAMTPIQRNFFNQSFFDKHYFNQSIMLYRKDGFDQKIIVEVLEKILEHHDILRAVFIKKNKNVIQYNRPVDTNLFDIKCLDVSNKQKNIEEIKDFCNERQSSLILESGPLLNVGLININQESHLLVVVHHLIIDAVSWRIFLEDFEIGYNQVLLGNKIKLPMKTHSFKVWADELVKYSVSKKLLDEIKYWSKIEQTDITKLPKDNDIDLNLRKGRFLKSSWFTLEKLDTSKLIKETHNAYNTKIDDILLAGLCLSVKEWSNNDKVLISVEGHGREEILENINVNRTIGWFTSEYPILFNLEQTGNLSEVIKCVKETNRSIPNKGVGYGILRYLTKDDLKEGVKFQTNPEIRFNYLGQLNQQSKPDGDKLFSFSDIESGSTISPEMQNTYSLEIGGRVVDGQLLIVINYNSYEYFEKTINELINFFKQNLLEIIEHCISKEELELTLSDFSTNKLDEEDIHSILENFED
jgi:amino acid adenylation domain-containing protein/non-ribosomal peptide synthase protein (TIGR01720 family)